MEWILPVLRILGAALASAAALALLVLFLPATLRLRYEDGAFSAHVRCLFFWIRLFPKNPAKAGAASDTDGERAKRGGSVDLLLIRDFLPPLKRFLSRLLRAVRVREIRLRAVVSGSDAGAVGMRTGAVWAAAGGLISLFGGFLRIRRRELSVIPDFFGERGNSVKFDCKITAVPVIIVAAAAALLWRFLVRTKAGRREAPVSGE